MSRDYSLSSFFSERPAMAYEDDLITLRERIVARLNDALGDDDVGPLPSYEIDGRKFDWNGYIRQLRAMLKDVDEQLAAVPGEEITVYIDPAVEK